MPRTSATPNTPLPNDPQKRLLPRAHKRWRYDSLCRIGTPRTTITGRIVDASAAGLRYVIADGLLPCVGDTVVLEWPDGTASFGGVVWIGGKDIGVALHDLVPDFRDRLDTASLGSESYGRLRALQAAWQAQRPA